MIRTQIQLTEEQYKFLREKSAEYNVSMASLIRKGVDLLVEQQGEPSRETLLQRALNIQAFEDINDAVDVSINHDKYLVEIYAQVGDGDEDLD